MRRVGWQQDLVAGVVALRCCARNKTAQAVAQSCSHQLPPSCLCRTVPHLSWRCPSLPSSSLAGSNSPSILPSYQQRELLELAVKSCKALGLQIVSAMAMGLGERLPSLSIELPCA